MTAIVPRDGWGALPAERFTTWQPRGLRGVVVHWFGIPKAAKDHTGCPSLLRSVQRSHQAGEFSDIAYNHGVCPHGVVYELRGFSRQTGANGNADANAAYAAVVYMAGEGDTPTEVGKQSLRWIIKEWRSRGVGPAVLPHGEITGSKCPGPDLALWIERGGHELPAIPVEDPAHNRKRLTALRKWILARRAEGWGWKRIKGSPNWREFMRRGGR